MEPQYITLPKRAMDVTGKKFNRLVALGPVGQSKNKEIVWLCQCECGNLTTVFSANLRNGHTKSCGCLHGEVLSARSTTHGMSGTETYVRWAHIIQRCTNPDDAAYPYYGGRGISIHAEWRFSFDAFCAHVCNLPNCGEEGRTLDRIDNNGNYEPGNVRWSTRIEQARNKRNNRLLTYNGETRCVADWAKEFQILPRTLHRRISLGWSVERALETPIWRGRWK